MTDPVVTFPHVILCISVVGLRADRLPGLGKFFKERSHDSNLINGRVLIQSEMTFNLKSHK